MKNEIVGKWTSDPNDGPTQKRYGHVSLEFAEDGTLVYTIYGEKKDQKIFLKYEIHGNVLVTDQPSSPRQERTEFSISEDGTLVLDYKSKKSRFIRSND